MVRIRLTKTGKRNAPQWRVGVFEKKTRRDGEPIEYLGKYDPHAEMAEDKLQIDVEKAEEWLEKGAQPSNTLETLFKEAGIGQ